MKYFALLLCLFCFSLIKAQEAKQREIGVTLNNLNFGAVYRTGTENKLWRFSTIYGNGSNYSETNFLDSVDIKRNTNHISLSVGREKRSALSDDLTLRIGVDIPASFGYYKRNHEDHSVNNYYDYNTITTSYGLGLDLVLGLNYSIGENFLVGLELLPGINYNFGKTITTQIRYNGSTGTYEPTTFEGKISSFNYGFSSGSALLTLVYKF